MTSDFAVIGHGRVGGALLVLLGEAGYTPAWVVSSRTLPEVVCPVFPEIPPAPGAARIVFLAVPDDHIEATAHTIAQRWGDAAQGLIFYHLSGRLTSDCLSVLAAQGAATASLHPLQSILDPLQARTSLRGSFFTVEGSPAAVAQADAIVAALGGTLMPIRKEDKVLYHAAAVIASNYLVSLLNQAEEILQGLGLTRAQMLPLVQGTLANYTAHGRAALTGPIRRGDWATVAEHVRALGEGYPDLLPAYLAMGRLTARLTEHPWPPNLGPGPKLLEWPDLARTVQALKQRGQTIVFTNGCFDIIHPGHVAYLREARALGDCLILGLNADASVRRLKGPTRPVNGQHARAEVLSGLTSVDYIAVFEEDTPYNLIDLVRPHILVKGGDWAIDTIVGADIVRAQGGQVRTIPFRDGHSTTGIIEKMKG